MLADLLRVSFSPSGPVLEKFLASRVNRQFIFGPLGSGKTFTCAMKALKLVCEQRADANGIRRSTGLVTRTAMTDLETSALKDWLELTEVKFGGALGRFNWASPRKHELRFRLPDQTSVEADIWFLGLDEPDGVMKVRGMPLTWAWLNEARDFSKNLVQMINGRCGRYPRVEDGGPTWRGLFGDTNMPYIGHWMHEMAEELRPEGWKFFRQPGGVIRVGDEWVENPAAENLAFLPEGYYRDQLQGADEAFINVYLASNYGFVMDGKPVYRDYNDSLHCKSVKPVLSRPIERGWDFGLTPACVFSQLQPDGRWIVFDELVSDDVGANDVGIDADVFSDAVLEHSARTYEGFKFEDSGDPSGADPTEADSTTCFQILRKKGIKVSSPFRVLNARATRAKDDLNLRLVCVSSVLRAMPGGRPRFAIDPEAQVTRKGLMGGYRFKRMHTKIERYIEKPEKNEYSHPLNALEYTAVKLFGALMLRETREPKKALKQRAAPYLGAQGWMA